MRLWQGSLILVAATVPMVRGALGSYSTYWSVGVVLLTLTSVALMRAAFPPYGLTFVAIGSLIVVSAVASSPTAAAPKGAVLAAGQLLIMASVSPALFTWIWQRQKFFVPRLAGAFVLGQTLSSTAAILQAGGLTLGGMHALYGRSPGLAGHPNTMGIMASIAILLALDTARRSEELPTRTAAFGVLLLNAAGLIVTGSTSSMLSLLVALLTYAYLTRVTATQVLWASSGVMAMVGISFVASAATGGFRSPIDRLAQVTGNTEEISTLNDRFTTIAIAWEGILRDPVFGVGLDDTSGGTIGGIVLTHNLPVRAWFQGGIFALIAILLIYGLLMAAIRRAATVRPSNAAVAIAVATAMCTFALTSALFHQPLYWAVLACSLTFALCQVTKGGNRASHSRSTPSIVATTAA